MDLKEHINFLVSQTLLEIRSKFKWEAFKNISDPYERMDYLEETGTTFLGEGSGRQVYLLSSRYVLKLAHPGTYFKRGVAQNEEEFNISQTSWAKDLVAHVQDHANDFSWIVSDLVRPLKNPGEFKALTGLEWSVFMGLLNFLEGQQDKLNSFTDLEEEIEEAEDEGDPEAKETKALMEVHQMMKSNPWIAKIVELILDSEIVVADLEEYDHWGKTADGRLVILDYGYSDDVKRKHYF